MRATNWLSVAAGLAGGLLVAACQASPAPPKALAPVPPAPPSDARRLQDRAWGVLRSAPLGLKLALPEARAWIQPLRAATPGAGWELLHQPTGTSLAVRRWRASRLPRIEACEAELRARTPNLLTMDETNLVARRDVRIPEGFVTRITLTAGPGRDQRLQGQALAVGAGVGECLSVVAHTQCATEAELAERLRLLDVALGHLRLMQIEDRVPSPQPISPRASHVDPLRPLDRCEGYDFRVTLAFTAFHPRSEWCDTCPDESKPSPGPEAQF